MIQIIICTEISIPLQLGFGDVFLDGSYGDLGMDHQKKVRSKGAVSICIIEYVIGCMFLFGLPAHPAISHLLGNRRYGSLSRG